MSAATDEILEKLKTLSLLEASELVSQIEEAFGVSAAAPVAIAKSFLISLAARQLLGIHQS